MALPPLLLCAPYHEPGKDDERADAPARQVATREVLPSEDLQEDARDSANCGRQDEGDGAISRPSHDTDGHLASSLDELTSAEADASGRNSDIF